MKPTPTTPTTPTTSTSSASPPGRVFKHVDDVGRVELEAFPADPAVHERIAQAPDDPFAFAVELLQSTAVHRPEPPPTAPAPAPPKTRRYEKYESGSAAPAPPKASKAEEVLKSRVCRIGPLSKKA